MTADWSREMRGLSLTTAPPLDNWLVFYSHRNCNEALSLMQTLHKVSGPLGIRMQKPTM